MMKMLLLMMMRMILRAARTTKKKVLKMDFIHSAGSRKGRSIHACSKEAKPKGNGRKNESQWAKVLQLCNFYMKLLVRYAALPCPVERVET